MFSRGFLLRGKCSESSSTFVHAHTRTHTHIQENTCCLTSSCFSLLVPSLSPLSNWFCCIDRCSKFLAFTLEVRLVNFKCCNCSFKMFSFKCSKYVYLSIKIAYNYILFKLQKEFPVIKVCKMFVDCFLTEIFYI